MEENDDKNKEVGYVPYVFNWISESETTKAATKAAKL